MNDPMPDFTPVLKAINRLRNGLDEPATAEEFQSVVDDADVVIAYIDYSK